MFTHARRTTLRVLVAGVAVVGQIALGATAVAAPTPEPAPTPVVPAAPTSPASPAAPASPEVEPLAPTAPSAAVLDVPDLGPIDPGPDGHVPITRERSKALQDIEPLPGLNPAPGTVPIERAPVTPQPPVSPYQLTLPQRPGQELVDATAADALATLGRAGRLNPDGTPDLDARKLQPQVSSAQFVDPSRPATIQELIDALLSGNIPPPLPVDPLALLNELPDGIPRITYRVCSESSTKQVSCSLTLPLGVPAIVDVTGDRTPDVLADLLPAVAVGDVVGPVREILDLDRQINDATARLNVLVELLKDPLNVILHPEWLLEKLELEELLRGLNTTVQEKLTALLDLINVGLAFLQLRLPTSEHVGRDLPGHVWAVYDIPGRTRLSLGFDGFRRGSSLPTGTLGIFTLNPIRALQGIYDIKATLLSAGAGESLAITAGMASVRDDRAGDAYDPTVASTRFSPVPNIFHAHAYIDPGAADRGQRATVDSSSNVRTHLDAQVLSNRGGTSRFDQLKVDMLPTQVSATVTRPVGGGEADVEYRADSTIDDVLFADYVYAGQRLDWALQAGAKAVPATWDANFKTEQDRITANYTASSRLDALDVNFYDRDPAIVGRGSLRALPTRLDLLVDRAASHVDLKAEQAIGSAAVAFSKNLGDYAPLDGDHATVITRDQKIGASARISGLKTVDAYFDGHTRLTTEFEPGGQAFTGAGDIDGLHKARLEVSNLPATLSVDADTANRTVAYRASAVVNRVHVAYTNTASGPTLFGTVLELPSTVDLKYEVGEQPRLLYTASSRVPRIELFASLAHIEALRPQDDHYLSALTTGVPTSVDVTIDLAAKHLKGTLAQTMDGITVVARAPAAGRDWTAIAELAGIPTEFDADWADGDYRFRALTAPLASARLAVTNHRDTVAPTGLHAAVHYRQSTGDLDASMAVRNLSHVEYSKTEGNQTFRLDTDTGGAPVFVDAEAILATADNVDDVKFAVSGRVDNLPSTIRVDYGAGRLTYAADRNIGLALNVAFGKIAALNGLGAPLFGNGVAAVARGCDDGTGCAKDDGPFCSTFPRCFGVVGTVSLPGLPTAVTVDMNARTVVLDDYRPTGPLQAYVGVHGLIDALPDFKALATLAGVPSPVDLTVGPIDVGGGKVDVGYTASAALGSLTLDVDTRTTDQRFPVVRGRAAVSNLPASMRVTGTLGDRTTLSMRNSAPVDEIALTVTGDRVGHLRAAVRGVPAEADVVVDATAKHAEVTMSAPISAVTALVRDIPVDGRNWSAFGELRDIPAKFTADWADGNYRLVAESSALGSATFAVTNHGGATSPVGPHLAGHFRELSNDIDASATIAGLRSVTYTKDKTGSTATLAMAATRIALDADAVFAANGADDTRIAATALLDTPNTVEIGMTEGKITYQADRQAGFQAEAYLGKIAALNGLGAPLFDNGVAARGRSCANGPGCVRDDSPFCTLLAACFGAVATVNLPGLPRTVTVDLKTKQVDLTEYSPAGGALRLYASLDGLVDKVSHAAGMVTLSGLSPTIDHLTVGPFHPADADPRGFTYAHDAHGASLGGVDARIEATTADYGTVYGAAGLSNVPSKVNVDGIFGSKSTVRSVASEGIGSLTAHVTAAFQGGPASGRLSITDVPAKLDFEMTGFASGAVATPKITYSGRTTADAPQSTLDGSAEVEADLVKGFPIGGVDIPLAGNAFAGFTDLGAVTTVALGTGTSVEVDSVPATAELRLGATVHTAYPVQQIDLEVFNEEVPVLGEAKGTLTGHAGVPEIKIDDFQLVLTGVRHVTFSPGANLSYLTTGIEGDFERIFLKFGGLTIVPDVDLTFHVDIPGPDQEVKLKLDESNTIHAIRFHLADQELRLSRKFDFGVACLGVSTLPGKFATSENEIAIEGRPGETILRTLNYLDPVPSPVGIAPEDMSFGIDMLTAYYTHPFNDPPARAAYDWSAGGC